MERLASLGQQGFGSQGRTNNSGILIGEPDATLGVTFVEIGNMICHTHVSFLENSQDSGRRLRRTIRLPSSIPAMARSFPT